MYSFRRRWHISSRNVLWQSILFIFDFILFFSFFFHDLRYSKREKVGKGKVSKVRSTFIEYVCLWKGLVMFPFSSRTLYFLGGVTLLYCIDSSSLLTPFNPPELCFLVLKKTKVDYRTMYYFRIPRQSFLLWRRVNWNLYKIKLLYRRIHKT